MKLATYNVKGINNPDKYKALWKWILREDYDVVCLEEHKLHHHAGLVSHCHQYTLFFGGIAKGYSGTLTMIKNSFQPQVCINHPSGRGLFINIVWECTSLTIGNIYGFNSAAPRTLFWEWMGEIVLEVPSGLLCGDFNMVESTVDSATNAGIMQTGEAIVWADTANKLNLQDLWLLHQPQGPGYTFHSVSHTRAWSRLERVYSIQ